MSLRRKLTSAGGVRRLDEEVAHEEEMGFWEGIGHLGFLRRIYES